MINTDNAALSATGRVDPVASQAASVISEIASTAGTNIDEIRSASLLILGVLNQSQHLGELRVRTNPRRLHGDETVGQNRSADHRVRRANFDRHCFTCHG